MCQRLNPTLHTDACTLEIGALIVIRGLDPATITNGTIIIFRPYPATPDYLVVHRVIKVNPPSTSIYNQYTFWTEGDANGVQDGWDQPNGGIPGSQVVGVYQATIPIPYLGAAILDIRSFMYDDATGQAKTQGILVIVALIVALFAFEVAEPGKKTPSSGVPEETKTSVSPAQVLRLVRHLGLTHGVEPQFFSLRPG